MCDELKKDPENEQELVNLKKFISEHEVNLSKLEKKVNRVNEFLNILDDNCYKY